MSRYLLSPAARADLDEIWDYTCQRWGIEQAEDYLRQLQRSIERAADDPRIGETIDQVRPGYLKLASGSHVVFYRLTADSAVDVIRILHQRMDIDRHL